MSQNLIYLLKDEDQTGVIASAIRGFFAGIIRFLYNWISALTDAMYEFATNDYLGLGSFVENFADKLFNALIIFMIFKLTFTFLTYLVNPDTFNDNSKGVQNVIKRIIITFALLVSINPIFTTLFTLQQNIIDDAVIDNLLLGTNNDKIYVTENGNRIYFTQISSFCEVYEPNKRVATFSKGDHLALLALKPFIQPVKEEIGDLDERIQMLTDLDYCGIDITNVDGIQYVDATEYSTSLSIGGLKDASGYLRWDIYNGATGKGIKNGFEKNYYLIDFNYFFALIVGIVLALLLISFCFDVVIRAFTLMLLQVVAPIPIISYVSPGGKSAEMLPTWGKKLLSTWASLFIRIIALDLALALISAVCESGGLGDNNLGLLMNIVIILGALMFAKKLPQLLEELFPGLKLSGLKLNPFKRVSEDALGGKAILGAGAALGGAALSGVTNLAHRALESTYDANGNRTHFGNWRNADGSVSFRSVLHGGLRTAGSTIAGATRGGVNAFNRTRKDGNMFGGMWNGYQTAMYSRLLRDENRRRGGTWQGAVAADLARWTGTLTEGQHEQIQAEIMDANIEAQERSLAADRRTLSLDKRQLAREKESQLKPFKDYSGLLDYIKSEVDNDRKVKEVQERYNEAIRNGEDLDATMIDIVQHDGTTRRETLRNAVKAQQSEVSIDLINNREDVRDAFDRATSMRSSNVELQGFGEILNVDGSFNRDVAKNTKAHATTVERTYSGREETFAERERVLEEVQNSIDATKASDEYRRLHDKSSPAKVANATMINNKVQEAGHMFSYGYPAQSTLGQQSFFNGPNGGPPPGPGAGPGGPGPGGPGPGGSH